MINEEKIKKHIKANTPLLIIGKSGWGKSAIVNKVAKDLKLPIITANVTSWTAEDFGGIPRPNKENTHYEYLPPKWAIQNKNKKFIFFIDEINQASVNVLHALYKVVLDREVAGVKLDFFVIAAGNFNYENPYLTDIPEPLLKRFSRFEWVEEHPFFCNYLNSKYGVNLKEIYTSPRETEMALNLYEVGDIESARFLGGEQLISHLKNNRVSKGEKLINELKIDDAKKRNGYLL